MKKEYSLVIASVSFLIAYLIDRISAVAQLPVRKPLDFLSSSLIAKYPFTALSILLKTLGLSITVPLLLSFIEEKYFTKAGFTLFAAVLAEFYAIQQTATGGRVTTIEWTLSFSYAGFFLLLLTAYYLIKGVLSFIHKGISEKEVSEESRESDRS